MHIYRLTNLITNKIYIGLTTKSPKYRLSDHLSESKTRSNKLIHKSIRKHGFDNFLFEVIFSIITKNKEDLVYFEKYFIKQFDCCVLDGRDKGYNMTRGGEGFDSELASILNRKRVENRTHYLLSEQANEVRKETNRLRIENGTHNFLGDAQSKFSTKRNLDRVANGTNPFAGELGRQNNLKRIESGTHNFIIQRTCPHCNLTGKGHNMLRYHFDNCKNYPLTHNTALSV